MMNVFEKLESEVRSYCRAFPTVFTTAKGATLTDENGKSYIDFFAGAGTLNYGHNNDRLKAKLIEYIQSDGITHSLDMMTQAKEKFLKTFNEVILEPRGLSYKVMFPGPTGTNSVEAALKIARKVTGRQNIISFTNGFHGMTLGALSVTGNSFKRQGAGVTLSNTTHMPFDGFMGEGVDTLTYLDNYLKDTSSGVDKPAAFIVETVQGEGGVNVASPEWVAGLAKLAKKHDIILIVDDIQVGCGRTGSFFSFERAGIQPDIVCLSKSLSGYGLPFAITLIRPELDQWAPGEHNGTFRGHNPAFVTATESLEFWRNSQLSDKVRDDAAFISERLNFIAKRYNSTGARAKGLGLIQGLEFDKSDIAGQISKAAFERGLIIETSGTEDQVLKVLPPLTIDRAALEKGMDIIEESVRAVCGDKTNVQADSARSQSMDRVSV